MDVIKQMLTGGGSMLAKILTGKEEKPEHTYIMESLSPSDIHLLINGLLAEGKINEAEDLLFEMMERSPCTELYNTGIAFFERLETYDDSQLADSNYTRDEIQRGINDFNDLKRRSVLF